MGVADTAGNHVVAVLVHRASDEYLAQLRERGVSYLLAGTGAEVDLAEALEKIGAPLGVARRPLPAAPSVSAVRH